MVGNEICDNDHSACLNCVAEEQGYDCTTDQNDADSTCTPVCGDLIVTGGEVCDADHFAC